MTKLLWCRRESSGWAKALRESKSTDIHVLLLQLHSKHSVNLSGNERPDDDDDRSELQKRHRFTCLADPGAAYVYVESE